jgi:hypothetical protein
MDASWQTRLGHRSGAIPGCAPDRHGTLLSCGEAAAATIVRSCMTGQSLETHGHSCGQRDGRLKDRPNARARRSFVVAVVSDVRLAVGPRTDHPRPTLLDRGPQVGFRATRTGHPAAFSRSRFKAVNFLNFISRHHSVYFDQWPLGRRRCRSRSQTPLSRL